jgi:hypothetical protein
MLSGKASVAGADARSGSLPTSSGEWTLSKKETAMRRNRVDVIYTPGDDFITLEVEDVSGDTAGVILDKDHIAILIDMLLESMGKVIQAEECAAAREGKE